MKNILNLIILSTFLLFFSCEKKTRIQAFYSNHWKKYSITIEDTLITGYVYDTYFKSKDSIVGSKVDTKIRWTEIDLSNGVKGIEFVGWMNAKNEIVLPYDPNYFSADTLFLKPITKNKFDLEIEKAFKPKLVDKNKTLVLDEYIFEIKVKNWNFQDGKGEAEVVIKDKTSKKIIQTIKARNFVFYTDIAIEFADKNFDGKKDLGFFIGNIGNKMSPAYHYYLFNSSNKQFEYSEDLSHILSQVGDTLNVKEKTITSYSTGGCCSHYADKYKVDGLNFIKIKKMKIISEGNVTVIVEELKNGSWHKRMKKYSKEEAEKIDFYTDF